MIVGVSVVLAVLSYFAYRHLCAACGDGGSASSASSALFMWPFVSLLRQSQSSLSDSSSPSASCILPETDGRLSSVGRRQQQQQQHQDPETTPKAKSVQSNSTIPAISLDDGDDDDDLPSVFPALNSAQRASSVHSSFSMPPPRQSLAMPPPPIPNRNPRMQSSSSWSRPNPNPSAAARSRLAVIGAGATGVAAGSGLTLPKARNSSSSNKSRRVILEPGHSTLDWARLQKSGMDLRGLPHSRLLKVPPSLLAQHKAAPEQVWMALNGRVYNVTAYIPFHPGGEKELLRGAGKDGTKLFNATHPWVNLEGMLEECLIGILVSEEEASVDTDGESELDRVD